jgi:hypothetical protein
MAKIQGVLPKSSSVTPTTQAGNTTVKFDVKVVTDSTTTAIYQVLIKIYDDASDAALSLPDDSNPEVIAAVTGATASSSGGTIFSYTASISDQLGTGDGTSHFAVAWIMWYDSKSNPRPPYAIQQTPVTSSAYIPGT